jgi:hypothetical protein
VITCDNIGYSNYKNAFILLFLSQTEAEEEELNKKRSKHQQQKMEHRKTTAQLTPGLNEQFVTGRLYGKRINFLFFYNYIG